MNFRGFAISAALIAFSLGHAAHAAPKDTCQQALDSLGYPTDDYSYEEPGLFTNERHNFGATACYVTTEGEINKIQRGDTVIAEQGYFGKATLSERDRIRSESNSRIDSLWAERNEKIDEIRRDYQARVDAVEANTENKLSDLRSASDPFSDQGVNGSSTSSQGGDEEADDSSPENESPSSAPTTEASSNESQESQESQDEVARSDSSSTADMTEQPSSQNEGTPDQNTPTEAQSTDASSGAEKTEKPRMYVTANRLKRRICPSTSCGVIGDLYKREGVTVHEEKDGWARISQFYTPCINGENTMVESGNDSCGPDNGIVDGQAATWVSMNYLTSEQPEDPAETATGYEKLVAGSTDFDLHRAAFASIAEKMIQNGTCDRAAFEEWGGFYNSDAEGEGIYFIYCGEARRENRYYVDVNTQRVYQ